MQEIFKSAKSKDSVTIILLQKTHKALFREMTVDNSKEHLNLITEIKR